MKQKILALVLLISPSLLFSSPQGKDPFSCKAGIYAIDMFADTLPRKFTDAFQRALQLAQTASPDLYQSLLRFKSAVPVGDEALATSQQNLPALDKALFQYWQGKTADNEQDLSLLNALRNLFNTSAVLTTTHFVNRRYEQAAKAAEFAWQFAPISTPKDLHEVVAAWRRSRLALGNNKHPLDSMKNLNVHDGGLGIAVIEGGRLFQQSEIVPTIDSLIELTKTSAYQAALKRINLENDQPGSVYLMRGSKITSEISLMLPPGLSQRVQDFVDQRRAFIDDSHPKIPGKTLTPSIISIIFGRNGTVPADFLHTDPGDFLMMAVEDGPGLYSLSLNRNIEAGNSIYFANRRRSARYFERGGTTPAYGAEPHSSPEVNFESRLAIVATFTYQ